MIYFIQIHILHIIIQKSHITSNLMILFIRYDVSSISNVIRNNNYQYNKFLKPLQCPVSITYIRPYTLLKDASDIDLYYP